MTMKLCVRITILRDGFRDVIEKRLTVIPCLLVVLYLNQSLF
jgi:hypothetical protein